MIDVKEFRIGNFILIDEKTCRINLLNNDPGFSETPCIGYESADDNGYEKCSSDRIQPSPINEEWIRKFELRFDDHLKMQQNPNDDTTLTMGAEIDPYTLEISRKLMLRNIKYIHSLQNLFFVLAGEELNVLKPKEAF